MKALDTEGREITLRGDMPLKLRLRGAKPFGAFKAKARTGNSHKGAFRMPMRPKAPKLSATLAFPLKELRRGEPESTFDAVARKLAAAGFTLVPGDPR